MSTKLFGPTKPQVARWPQDVHAIKLVTSLNSDDVHLESVPSFDRHKECLSNPGTLRLSGINCIKMSGQADCSPKTRCIFKCCPEQHGSCWLQIRRALSSQCLGFLNYILSSKAFKMILPWIRLQILKSQCVVSEVVLCISNPALLHLKKNWVLYACVCAACGCSCVPSIRMRLFPLFLTSVCMCMDEALLKSKLDMIA